MHKVSTIRWDEWLAALDRALLDRMVEIRLQDRTADIAHLAPGLGPQGAAVYALLADRAQEGGP